MSQLVPGLNNRMQKPKIPRNCIGDVMISEADGVMFAVCEQYDEKKGFLPTFPSTAPRPPLTDRGDNLVAAPPFLGNADKPTPKGGFKV